MEMVGFTSPATQDATIAMEGDSDGFNGADSEMMAIDLKNISPRVRCIVLLATCLSGTFGTVGKIQSVVKRVEYINDEMAARPGVPMFKTHKVIDSATLFNVGISPALADNSNCLVLYKLFRGEDKNATAANKGE